MIKKMLQQFINLLVAVKEGGEREGERERESWCTDPCISGGVSILSPSIYQISPMSLHFLRP